MAARYRGLDQIFGNIVEEFKDGMVDAIIKVVPKGTEKFAKFTLASLIARDSFKTPNENIAKVMQETVLRQYRDRVTARKKIKQSYRIGQNRDSGGALRNAIAGEGFYTATGQGIQFGNRRNLDAQAKHWWRLNFGTAGGNNGEPEGRPVNFLGSQKQFLIQGKPSKSFQMPYGIWRTRGTDANPPGFYPLKKRKRPGLHDISARRFFDGASFAFAQEFPPEYQTRIDAVIKAAVKQASR